MVTSAPTRPWRFSLRQMLIAIAVVGVLLGVSVGVLTTLRSLKRRAMSRDRFRYIAQALAIYHENFHAFPPAILQDAQGRPLKSWRFEAAVYTQSTCYLPKYLPDQPWNHPTNLAVCDFPIPYYQSTDAPPDSRLTNMIMPVGAGTIGERSISLDEISDRHEETILLLGLQDTDIPWYEPRDLSIDDVTRAPGNRRRILIHGKLFQGAWCALVDGSVAWLPANLDFDTFRAMLTIGGGEQVDMSWRK